jgi:hypothetical protein
MTSGQAPEFIIDGPTEDAVVAKPPSTNPKITSPFGVPSRMSLSSVPLICAIVSLSSGFADLVHSTALSEFPHWRPWAAPLLFLMPDITGCH